MGETTQTVMLEPPRQVERQVQTFNYEMPQTQYLGSKAKLLDWIVSYTPSGDSVFDAFTGSGVVAFEYKKMGRQVITNDYLNFNYQTSLAIIENNNVRLSENDIKKLLVRNPKKNDFIAHHYSDIFYTQEECEFLDNLHENIISFDDEYKRALAFAAICRTCIQKMPMGKFRGNLLQYRDKKSPYYRPKFARDIQETFLDFLEGYNSAVFDNGQENVAHVGDTKQLAKQIDTEIAYFDPPYCGSGYHYESDYFFIELYTKYYDKDLILTGKMKKYRGMQKSGFDKPKEIVSTLDELFTNVSHIPTWVISYNNRSAPGLQPMLDTISKYRNVRVVEKEYKYKFVGNSGLKEYLFICD